MPSLEAICRQFFQGSPWAGKILLGAALMIVPIVNFVALGYLLRIALHVRHGEGSLRELPNWDDWRELFRYGLLLTGVFLLFGGVPVLVGLIGSWLFYEVLDSVGGEWLVWMAGVPVSVALFVALPLSAAALYRFMENMNKARLLLPTFCFIGFCYILTPILPFAIFLGLALILQYYILMFRYTELQ
jgi:hypothetical protein